MAPPPRRGQCTSMAAAAMLLTQLFFETQKKRRSRSAVTLPVPMALRRGVASMSRRCFGPAPHGAAAIFKQCLAAAMLLTQLFFETQKKGDSTAQLRCQCQGLSDEPSRAMFDCVFIGSSAEAWKTRCSDECRDLFMTVGDYLVLVFNSFSV